MFKEGQTQVKPEASEGKYPEDHHHFLIGIITVDGPFHHHQLI